MSTCMAHNKEQNCIRPLDHEQDGYDHKDSLGFEWSAHRPAPGGHITPARTDSTQDESRT